MTTDRPGDVAYVAHAAEVLYDAIPSRAVAILALWMSIKRQWRPGLASIEFSRDDVESLCLDYYGVHRGDDLWWYVPFSQKWWGPKSNGGWPRSTVWKNAQSASMFGLFDITDFRRASPSFSGHATYTPKAEYPLHLRVLFEDYGIEPIPALSFAIWRYRFGVPDGVTAEEQLIESLVSELNLSQVERQLLLQEGD